MLTKQLLVPIFAAVSAASRSDPFCQSFHQTANYTRQEIDAKVRISPAVTCPPSSKQGCKINAQGSYWLEQTTKTSRGGSNSSAPLTNSTINPPKPQGTITSDQVESAAYTIHNVTGAPTNFKWSKILTPNITLSIPANTSAYVAWVPQFRCIDGILSDCPSGLNVTNGSSASVCRPFFTDQIVDWYKNVTAPAGRAILMHVNENTADRLRGNPYSAGGYFSYEPEWAGKGPHEVDPDEGGATLVDFNRLTLWTSVLAALALGLAL